MRAYLLFACLFLPSPAVPAELPSIDRAVRTNLSARDDAAVVIGVEQYGFLPAAAHAARDADAFYDFLVYTRGIPSSRVNRVKPGATRGEILAAVSEAGAQAGPGGVAWVYFAGHGAASPSTRERMLLPANTAASEAGFDETGVLVKELQGLAGAGGGEVLVVTDACFTGAGRDGSALLASGRSWVPPTASASGKAAQWDAVAENQVARPLDAVGHGAFTYFALGALRGWADGHVSGTPDGVVTAAEAQLYVRDALRSIGMREQTPSLVGSGAESRVLATIPEKVRERGPVLVASVESPPVAPVVPVPVVVPRTGEAVVVPRTGEAVVVTDGRELDFGELARQAQAKEQEAAEAREAAAAAAAAEQRRVADEARAVAEREAAAKLLRDELERRLAADRRGKIDAAVATLRASATRDYAAISALVASPSKEGAPVLEAYLARYGSAKVTIDGTTETVAIAEVATVEAALAKSRGGSGGDWRSPTLGLMKWIPAGSFTMGSPPSEAGRSDDEAQRRVTLTQGFWLQEHEVTQGEWQAVMGTNPSNFSSCGPSCPVELVSWDDAVSFAKKVSARDGVNYALPTEAQWEYAARGGQSYAYAGGDELGEVGWYVENSGSKTHAACGKRRNGYGLCDMSGNVWEWTSDWYGGYPPGAVPDPHGASAGSSRMSRGGSWYDAPALARVANRYGNAPSYRGDHLGFRLARASP